MVHVHKVIEMIWSAERNFTVCEFSNQVKSAFGEKTVFINCSNIPLGPQDVLLFLLDKKKVVIENEKVVPVGHSCKH